MLFAQHDNGGDGTPWWVTLLVAGLTALAGGGSVKVWLDYRRQTRKDIIDYYRQALDAAEAKMDKIEKAAEEDSNTRHKTQADLAVVLQENLNLKNQLADLKSQVAELREKLAKKGS